MSRSRVNNPAFSAFLIYNYLLSLTSIVKISHQVPAFILLPKYWVLLKLYEEKNPGSVPLSLQHYTRIYYL